MAAWPEHVSYAFGKIGYDSAEVELAIEAFASQWGGLDVEHFLSVLRGERNKDTVLALFAIGYEETEHTRETLFSFVHSPYPEERWASRLGLLRLQEEQALLLFLPLVATYISRHNGTDLTLYSSQYDYDVWCLYGIRLLGDWIRPELADIFLDLLRSVLECEQGIETLQIVVWKRRRSNNFA